MTLDELTLKLIDEDASLKKAYKDYLTKKFAYDGLQMRAAALNLKEQMNSSKKEPEKTQALPEPF